MLQSLNSIAEPTVTGIVLRFLLCSAYVWSGITKLLDFAGTVRHFANRFQLPAPHAAAALVIAVQLSGSAMFITGWRASVAAILLAGFTLAATVIAYPFWTMTGVERSRNIETFFEHIGLAAAFLILAWPIA